MSEPIVIACRLIWTVYGWWLPNDPRGSTARVIASERIAELGALHYGRKRIQPASREIRDFCKQAGGVLRHPLLEIQNACVSVVGAAFDEVITRERYTCAVMPDHVHILIRKHRHQTQEMIELLQNPARSALNGRHSSGTSSCRTTVGLCMMGTA